jgi:NAD(P)H-flavin reductase
MTPQKLRCQVEAIIDHGDHVYTVDLIPEKKVPQFRPGQFLHLALDEYDPSGFWPESRVFSIANSPARRDFLRISYSVRGRFTTRMERELHLNQWVWVKLPYGDFVIDGSKDVVLLAGGTGITAFTAFLDGLTSSFPHNVYLIYGARNRNLLIYLDLLQQRVQTAPQLHVFYFVEHSNDEDSVLNEILGCLSVTPLWSNIENPLEAQYYLSGPPAMLKVISRELIERSISKESIKIDAWE